MMRKRERSNIAHVLEDSFCIVVLAAMSVLPLVHVVSREWLGSGFAGSILIVQHMTMWISFLGAALAARSDRLLALSTSEFLPARYRGVCSIAVGVVSVAITSLLGVASLQLVAIDRSFGDIAAWGVPIWVFTAVMPIAFAMILLRLIWHASSSWRGRVIAATGCLFAALFFVVPDASAQQLLMPLGAMILAAMVLGMPIYAALGGAALLLFWAEGTPISAVPGEAYRMSTSAMLPAIPLFTLAGYLLAEGGSSKRLLRLFSALVGWMPGGIAIVVTLVLAFFTPLTGASGITILAMGGLLLPMLVRSGYSETHSLGLVTVSGSIGIFFPPSLPVILYAFYADLELNTLFLAGLLPGLLLIAAVGAWGALRGSERALSRTQFDARELRAALWEAKWEVLLPIVIVGGIFGGYATLVEASAITVLYAMIVEFVVFKELSWRHDLRRIMVESATMIGGFMIILSVALGLTNYLIIAQIPSAVLEWVSEIIESPYVFLLTLNLFLIVVGALMDIYSAIIVIVPLIAPMAAAYGINPTHLAIVFLANMQLGYLMPPMGENLFLSAYRFEQPLTRLYRCVLPFVAVILAVVLVVTYVPALTLWALDVLNDALPALR
jgi:tripartite ATP-independent transporter DctM subunit